jgi:hypothetical protein
MVSGDGVTDSGDDIDRHDVTHATENAEVSVADTIALLQENGRRTELVIRQLSEEDLDRTAAFGPADGQALPVGRLAAETSRHACGHLAHATEAMAASA